MAARVARQDLAASVDDALVGAEQAVDVAIVAGNPGLGISAVAGSPRDGSGLVVCQALHREGVEDKAGGGDDGVVRASHVARDAVDGSTVRSNALGGDATGAKLDLGSLAGPEVLNGQLGVGVDAGGADTELAPRDGSVADGAALVEDGHDTVAVGNVLGEHVPGRVGAGKGGLLDKSVLVDGNEVLVDQEVDLVSREGSDISANDERSREDGPESHVGLLLVQVVVGVVDVEEVGVVEVARLLVASKADLLAVVGQETAPGVQATPVVAADIVGDDVVGVTCKLASLGGPAHNGVPVSEVGGAAKVGGRGVRENNSLGEALEELEPLVVDGVVSRLRTGRNVATIQLQVVKTPVREGLEVKLLVVESSRVPAARQGARVAVDTRNKALAANVLGEPGETLRELLDIPFHGAVGGTALGGPGVVQVDAVVASGEHAVGGHGIGSRSENALADVGGVASPVVEAHGRERHSLGVRASMGSANQASGRSQNMLRLHYVN